MNGPEHYAEAERLLGLAMLDENSVEDGYAGEIAAAQVHATLALVAAQVTHVPLTDEDPTAFDVVVAEVGWEKVLGFDVQHRDGGWTR